MGNYGNTLDRWYRRAAVVLWPRQRSFAARAEAGPEAALHELRECLQSPRGMQSGLEQRDGRGDRTAVGPEGGE